MYEQPQTRMALAKTYIVYPGYPVVGGLGLHPAVKVHVPALVHSVRRNVLAKAYLNVWSI